jgi:hypothetical protein
MTPRIGNPSATLHRERPPLGNAFEVIGLTITVKTQKEETCLPNWRRGGWHCKMRSRFWISHLMQFEIKLLPWIREYLSWNLKYTQAKTSSSRDGDQDQPYLGTIFSFRRFSLVESILRAMTRKQLQWRWRYSKLVRNLKTIGTSSVLVTLQSRGRDSFEGGVL